MKNSTELHKLDIQIAAELFGWEQLEIVYWGEEGGRQKELEDWIRDVGPPYIGDYFLDIENQFWIDVDDWNPTIDEKQAIMILRWLENNDWHWKLSNMVLGSDAIVYEFRAIKHIKLYACEHTIPLAICHAAKQLI